MNSPINTQEPGFIAVITAAMNIHTQGQNAYLRKLNT